MHEELTRIGIKVAFTLLFTPIMGWGLMIVAEKFEASWKTNNRKKKWLTSCSLFLFLAAISGWFL